jgi:glucose/arabinose dehydrogenase
MKNNKKISIIAVVMVFGAAFVWYLVKGGEFFGGRLTEVEKREEFLLAQEQDLEIVAQNLLIPWELAFLPDGGILVTERGGTLRKIGQAGFLIKVPEVVAVGEGGLLGMALHPEFVQNHWVYFYYTTNTTEGLKNIVARYVFSGGQLQNKTEIVAGIPASFNHNGGRIAFGPDNFLYITTGDAERSDLAQDVRSLAGKILRVKDDGSFPPDNPFNNAVYSYGHRNPQGLAWDGQGRLWATEHGRSGVFSGYDELNLIKKGNNYGWPIIEGEAIQAGMDAPVINSGPDVAWAPSGIAYYSGELFFAGLRGETLYAVSLAETGEVAYMRGFFQGMMGRLRTVSLGPDGYLYVLTSNTDGRGTSLPGDDVLVRINPAILSDELMTAQGK